MKTPILHCLIGTSLSGKSTYAKEKLLNDSTRIIGRDKIREMLFGYTEDNVWRYYEDKGMMSKEKEVSAFQKASIESLINSGYDVVIDNTHLRKSYINQLIKDFYYCTIKFHLVEQPYDTCVSRNASRTRKISEEVLQKQFKELKSLKSEFDFKTYSPNIEPLEYIIGREEAVTFDLDGTLALHWSGRSPYDSHRVLEDTLCEQVFSLYKGFKAQGYKIIICTGRDKIAESDSKLWLEIHGIEWDEFHIRGMIWDEKNQKLINDSRKDYIIKEEFWRDISTRYNIFAQVDDRDQVVHHGRRLGMKVLQVYYGNF